MSAWQKTRIGDIAEFNALSVGSTFEYDTIEYIDTSSVDKGKLIQTQMIPLKDAPSRAKRLIRQNDILISSVRPNLEHYYFVHASKANAVASTGFVVISPKSNVVPYFLYCLLTTPSYTKYLTQIANSHTSTFPSFNPDIIENSEFKMPTSLEEQQEISSIFYSVDRKIDLLSRQNETLENIAQLLFKHWFIDFEFPDEKGQPYKSSRGKMVPHRDFGEIPEGWIHSKIGKEIEILGGGTPSTDEPLYWEGGNIDWYTPTDLTSNNDLFSLGSARKISESGLVNSSAKIFPEYSLMMSSRATIGEIAINTRKSCTNQGFITLIANENYPISFLHCWLLRQLKMIKKLASGSTFPEIGRGEFNDLDIIKPSPEVMMAFRNLVEPTYRKIENNIKESKSLTSIRDILLPKLMSGRIRITG